MKYIRHIFHPVFRPIFHPVIRHISATSSVHNLHAIPRLRPAGTKNGGTGLADDSPPSKINP